MVVDGWNVFWAWKFKFRGESVKKFIIWLMERGFTGTLVFDSKCAKYYTKTEYSNGLKIVWTPDADRWIEKNSNGGIVVTNDKKLRMRVRRAVGAMTFLSILAAHISKPR